MALTLKKKTEVQGKERKYEAEMWFLQLVGLKVALFKKHNE